MEIGRGQLTCREQIARNLRRHARAGRRQRMRSVIGGAVSFDPSRVLFSGRRQSIERIEAGDAPRHAFRVERMSLRQQREAHAGEHAELEDVPLDALVVDEVDGREERLRAGITADEARHHRLVAASDHEVACLTKAGTNLAAHRHQTCPASACSPTAHVHGMWTKPFRSAVPA